MSCSYGAVVAYRPADLELDGPQAIAYTSDGSTPLNVSAKVYDLAGVPLNRGAVSDSFFLFLFLFLFFLFLFSLFLFFPFGAFSLTPLRDQRD